MQPDPRTHPTRVKAPRNARTLEISWADGHQGIYPHEILRGYCPCAGCQGHAPNARYLDLEGHDLVHLEGVGNYALAPTWADGHNTGIYSFRLLRGLCPCADCGGEKR